MFEGIWSSGGLVSKKIENNFTCDDFAETLEE